MSDRRSYGLTPDDVRTIRRALADRRDDVQADPDYADDEREEHLADIKSAGDALDVADYQREQAESIEWRILVDDGRHGPEVTEEPVNESAARYELARYRSDYPHHTATLECREVGAWRAAPDH